MVVRPGAFTALHARIVNDSIQAPSVNDLKLCFEPSGDPAELDALRADASRDPHALLVAHPACIAGERGTVVRAFHPDAVSCMLVKESAAWHMEPLGGGLFAAFLPRVDAADGYRLRFEFSNGATWEREDPYRFPPSLGALDLHLISEGTHHQLW